MTVPPTVVDICEYDSTHRHLTFKLKEASICYSLVTQKGHFTNGNTQHQHGGANSGLFAILAAVCVCHGKDPAVHAPQEPVVDEKAQYRES